MEVGVVQLASSAGHAGAVEVGHEVNILTRQMGVMRKVA